MSNEFYIQKPGLAVAGWPVGQVTLYGRLLRLSDMRAWSNGSSQFVVLNDAQAAQCSQALTAQSGSTGIWAGNFPVLTGQAAGWYTGQIYQQAGGAVSLGSDTLLWERAGYWDGAAWVMDQQSVSLPATMVTSIASAVWNTLTSSLTTAGSVGKRIADYLDMAISALVTRLTGTLVAVPTPTADPQVFVFYAGDAEVEFLDQLADRNGAVVAFDDDDTVVLRLLRRESRAVLFEAAAVWTDAATGQLKSTLSEENLAEAGEYLGYWIVTHGTQVQTYPIWGPRRVKIEDRGAP